MKSFFFLFFLLSIWGTRLYAQEKDSHNLILKTNIANFALGAKPSLNLEFKKNNKRSLCVNFLFTQLYENGAAQETLNSLHFINIGFNYRKYHEHKASSEGRLYSSLGLIGRYNYDLIPKNGFYTIGSEVSVGKQFRIKNSKLFIDFDIGMGIFRNINKPKNEWTLLPKIMFGIGFAFF